MLRIESVRRLIFLASFFKKTYKLFQTRHKWTCDNKFPWVFQNFDDLSFFRDFSRPGNDHFKIPWLFQVFRDRTNPVKSAAEGAFGTFQAWARPVRQGILADGPTLDCGPRQAFRPSCWARQARGGGGTRHLSPTSLGIHTDSGFPRSRLAVRRQTLTHTSSDTHTHTANTYAHRRPESTEPRGTRVWSRPL